MLVRKLLQGDRRSAAKAISIVENDDILERNELLNLIYPYGGKAKVIGITGPPGAGKSTLVDALIQELRQNNFQIGVIAIDPSSPFTGGALLGDRIRMQRHATDPGVFIRSMGTRGTLGGLARSTRAAVSILDAMGLDIIIIETVGVGQSELEIIKIADTTIVVLQPNSGDSIQIFKAGIMEVADIFVINKSDIPESQKIFYEIETLLDLTKQNNLWRPPVIKTIGIEQKGISSLWQNILKHYHYLSETGIINEKKKQNFETELKDTLHDLFQTKLNQYLQTKEAHVIREKIKNKYLTPFELAEKIIRDMLKNI